MSIEGSRESEDGNGTGREGGAGIVVTIKTKDPLELEHFGEMLTSISNEYYRVCGTSQEVLVNNRLVVRTTRPGCFDIFSEIITGIQESSLLEDIAKQMFIQGFFKFFKKLKTPEERSKIMSDLSGHSLERIKQIFKPIAKDSSGSVSIGKANFSQSGPKKVDEQADDKIEFDTSESKEITKEAEFYLAKTKHPPSEGERTGHFMQEKVNLTFNRIDRVNAKIDKPFTTKMRAVVEDFSPKGVHVRYRTKEIEEQIKNKFNNLDRNILFQTFFVDLCVHLRNEKLWAYEIMCVHD